MFYQILARKYRPQNFNEVIGQNNIIKSLMYSLENNRIHHSYMFIGTHGTGKTSIARILAKSINCMKGISSNPCNKCDHCSAIRKNKFVDLIEIDAASKTKVEDTREVLENIKYMPSQGRYKIYIIDEVHMLSKYSFNALLKSLEEPPKHIKFILATTEIKKIPETVSSRCLQFYLKKITNQDIHIQLQHILQKELIKFQDEALEIIAQHSEGSMRNALSLTDQAISFGKGQVFSKEIEIILGIADINIMDKLIIHIVNSQKEKIINLSHTIIQLGKDPIKILDNIAAIFYSANIYQITKKINCLYCKKFTLIKISNTLSANILQIYYKTTIQAKKYIHLSPTLECGLTMALLQLSTVDLTNIEINDDNNNQQEIIKKGLCSQTTDKNIKNTKDKNHSNNKRWDTIKKSIKLKGISLQIILNSNLEKIEDNNKYILTINNKIKNLITKDIQKKIENAISQNVKQKVNIRFISNDISYSDQSECTSNVNKNEKLTDKTIESISQNENIKKLKKIGFSITCTNNT